MEHSLKAYLKRLPTETLKNFLETYKKEQSESYRCILDEIIAELARRKREEA